MNKITESFFSHSMFPQLDCFVLDLSQFHDLVKSTNSSSHLRKRHGLLCGCIGGTIAYVVPTHLVGKLSFLATINFGWDVGNYVE